MNESVINGLIREDIDTEDQSILFDDDNETSIINPSSNRQQSVASATRGLGAKDKDTMLKSFCSSQEKLVNLKKQHLELEQKKFELERENVKVLIRKRKAETTKLEIDGYISLLTAVNLERQMNLTGDEVTMYRKRANFLDSNNDHESDLCDNDN